MVNRTLKLCLIVALTASMALVGCGDSDSTDNNGTDNNSSVENNGTENNGTENNGTENNSTENNSTENNSTENNSTENNSAENNSTPEPVDGPVNCDSDPKPERCDVEPDGYDGWESASVLSSLTISAATDADGDPACCFDLTGNGINNNALGQILPMLEGITGEDQEANINNSIAEGIADGTIVVPMEHYGLTDVDGGKYTINFFLGQYTVPPANDAVELLASSFEQGAHPYALLPGASINGNKLAAGPGTVFLELSLFDAALNLIISNTQIEADVTTADPLSGEGIALENGKLGGAVAVNDLFDAVNSFASSCDCLGNPDQMIIYEPEFECVEPTNSCEEEANEACGAIASYCSYLSLLVSFADVDLDGDGMEDAISLGAEFTADPTVITGVGEEEAAE